MEGSLKCIKPLSSQAAFGFLYVAAGRQYVEEAVLSMRSLRESNPSAVVAVAIDLWDIPEASEFDCVLALEKPEGNSNDKIAGIKNTPFPKTVFLDTDTRILEPLGDLELILQRCDIAMALDPIWESYPQPDIPESFPTFNSGVMAFRRSLETSALFRDWLEAFRAQELQPGEARRDQPPLRKVLYHSNVRIGVLPPEYNLRVIYPFLIGGNARIKILHGRHEHQEEALKLAGTAHVYPRVFGRTYGTAELGKIFLRQCWRRLCSRLGVNRDARRKRVGVTTKF